MISRDAPVDSEGPTVPAAAVGDPLVGETLAPNHRVGSWRILHELGRGGMGAVYLAVRDDEQYEKRVAIKIVKRGMDTDFILRRFRNERQILAALEHPNIARLIDAGSLPDGRPYFVLELVEGEPLADYCARRGLSVDERLQLFLQVCGAVHYAHQNLVIHRDLKPGNILVTPDGMPKLLDFGIAKLLNADGSTQPLETATEFRLMTPEYASPEQVRGEPITTATDVYALGVVLYELLTEQRPYRLTSRRPEEMARVICHEMPARPSTAAWRRLTPERTPDLSPTVGPSTVAAQVARDGSEPVGAPARDRVRRLRRRLAGDLDTIVLKAMAKEPARRYASVEQLAADIKRHVRGLPVLARPDTLGYRLGKFARRNKAGVAAAVLVFASLVAGLIATLWQAQVASAERARAVARLDDVRTLANAFIFDIHDAIAPLPGSTNARQLLVTRALAYLDRLASEQEGSDPGLLEELAAGYQKLGDVQGRRQTAHLGDTAGALASQHKALALRERVAALMPADISARVKLATSHMRVGEMLLTTGDTAGAAAHYTRAVSALEPLAASGASDDELGRQLSEAYERLGVTTATAGDVPGALRRFEQAREITARLVARAPEDPSLRRMLAVDHQRIGNALGNPNFPNMGDAARASVELSAAVKQLEALAAEYPTDQPIRRTLAVVHGNLADVVRARSDLAGSLAGNRRALAIFQELLDADGSNVQAMRDVALSYSKVAELQSAMGRLSEASADGQLALVQFQGLAQADPTNAMAQNDLAAIYSLMADIVRKRGDPDAALGYLQRMLTIVETLARKDPTNVEHQYSVGIAYGQLGEAREARALRQRGAATTAGLREARADFERAAQIFAALEKRGTLTGSDAEQPRQMAANIARIDRRLGGR